ncbi:Uncharacterised protein [Escherichia coli]|nr:Uncharacterised protein [Escherichia coli]
MLEEVSDLRFQQFRQIVNVFNVIVFLLSLLCGTATSFASSPASSVIFRTPTGRQRITEPAAAGTELGPVRQPGHRPETGCG